MFGYIKPFKPDLRFCEYDIYKAAYCSLCKALGKNYGFIPQLLLNYDFAFLSLICLALDDNKPCISKGRCQCNPLKKCLYCNSSDEKFDMLSAVVVISVYYNLTDDIEDNKGIKSLFKRLCRAAIRRSHKKASRLYPQIDDITKELIQNQNKLEQNKSASLDEASEPSSIFLSKLAASVCSDRLSQMGYHLGRWIYLIDCADDLQKDIKSGGYNPLKLKFDLNPDNLSSLNEAYNYIKQTLERTQIQLCYEYDRLKFKRYEQIIGNIIFEGLPSVTNRIFNDIGSMNENRKGVSK